MKVKVIGAGLAGCEAALQLAKNGISVDLYEMKPKKFSPAHSSEKFAELVCSNSLKAERIENACGLLKEEMRLFSSVMMEAADISRVPAGGALAVDRDVFSQYITDKIKSEPLINVINDEITEIDTDEYTVIATGPLTSDDLAKEIKRITGDNELYFYDAAAPIVTEESIDKSKVFKAARYDRGTADYINCPMTKEEYTEFYNALVNAETAPLKGFENQKVFEGCMPVEVMAKRGFETLTFGPLKPVGLVNPKTGRDDAYAVVQLRCDNKEGTLYNLVGFQTNLKWGEQKRVFSMITGLENAEFVRYGVMHRNTYINSPMLLDKYYRMKKYPKIFFAGQITGVEGYVESASSGILAGYNMSNLINGKDMFEPDSKTCIGALPLYISNEGNTNLQPMNANFGIIEGLNEKIRNKAERYNKIAVRALDIVKKQLEGK
ncbi:methylenetetrahydrofolate--tRNA-(uracil(54)-C(5))-methyltransferase (FADH(2)-oxidizing) TrmFO [Lachnospiraceae bacterium MD329]|nr:methylenetetrahydrofolate--tRNA-(uracil(54)-C(5))-methyltransferase (FADH(2)-oxidizing) TrmFO [Lachnospiraceae bacterium MD329]